VARQPFPTSSGHARGDEKTTEWVEERWTMSFKESTVAGEEKGKEQMFECGPSRIGKRPISSRRKDRQSTSVERMPMENAAQKGFGSD